MHLSIQVNILSPNHWPVIFLENDIWAIIKQEPMFEKKLVKGLLTACRLTIGLWG